jgi:nucleoside-diphosphate-sugar epimerase
MEWRDRPVLVTGGASFIGSHLVDALVERGASVSVVDDLSSGHLENIRGHVDDGRVEFIKADLREPGVASRVVRGKSVVCVREGANRNESGCGAGSRNILEAARARCGIGRYTF